MTRSDYVRVDLRIEHPSATAKEIAEMLGVQPGAVGTKGEPRGRPRPDRPVPHRATWQFHYASFPFGEGDGREQLDAAFHLIREKSAEISRLIGTGGRAMLSILAAPAFGWGAEIGVRELELLVRAGVELGVEVYREPGGD